MMLAPSARLSRTALLAAAGLALTVATHPALAQFGGHFRGGGGGFHGGGFGGFHGRPGGFGDPMRHGFFPGPRFAGRGPIGFEPRPFVATRGFGPGYGYHPWNWERGWGYGGSAFAVGAAVGLATVALGSLAVVYAPPTYVIPPPIYLAPPPIIVGLPAIAPLPFAEAAPTVAPAVDYGPLIASAAPPPVLVLPPPGVVAEGAPPPAILAPEADGLVIAPPALAYAEIPTVWRVGGYITGAYALRAVPVVHATYRPRPLVRYYAPPPVVVYVAPPVFVHPWGGPGWGHHWGGPGWGHWGHHGRY